MMRAIRRYHRERLRRKRQQTHHWAIGNDRLLGIYIDTPCPCSCMFCTRNRALYGAPISERRAVAEVPQ